MFGQRRPYPANLNELFALACRAREGADLFVDEAERVTGAEAGALSAQGAAALAASGLRGGDRIAFLCRGSVRHALGFFAAQRVGAVSAHLHLLETDANLADAVDWLEARMILADAESMSRAEAVAGAAAMRPRVVSLEADGPLWSAPHGQASAAERGPDDLARIVLSSGSTGRPKGIMHTHATLMASALAGSAVYGRIAHHDAVLVAMSPSFAAWYNVVLPFLAGHAKIVLARRFVPENFLRTLAAERVTLAPLVPTLWRMVLAAGPEGHDLSALRAAMFSGEPGVKRDVEALASRICPHVIGAYLSSEGACASAVVADERDLIAGGKPECAGRPIAGADLRIIDPEAGIDDELPAGEIGEIAIRSASVAAGYWKDEALTRQRFVNGWWRSGDLGVRDETGTVFVKGRLDNVINTGGVKVHAEEVEAALMRCPAVRQAAVIGVADETWGARIEAFVVPAEPNASADAILAFCRDNHLLAPARLPKSIRFVEALPTGPTGKLSRAALRASTLG